MQYPIHSLAAWLRKRRRLVAAVAVFVFVALSSWIALPRRTRDAGSELLCSTKANLSCNRVLARRFLDPSRTAVRVDRIVSGALRLASSL